MQQTPIAPLLQRPRRQRQQILRRLQRLPELPLAHARAFQIGQNPLQNLPLRHPAQKRLRARPRLRIRLPQPRRQLLAVDRPALVKRIQIVLPPLILILHQKVKRRAHPLQRNPRPPTRLDHDHRQRDRHPPLRLQRAVQAAVRRLVIRLRVAPKAAPLEQRLAQRRDRALDCALDRAGRAGRRCRLICQSLQPVERRQRVELRIHNPADL